MNIAILRRVVSVLLLISSTTVQAAPSASTTEPPPRIPVQVFFGSAELSQLKFSPNGKYLAALVPVDRRLNLLVMDLEKGTKQLITRLSDESIVMYGWANDDRILFYRDEGGRENFGLYAVNRSGGVVDRLAYAGDRLLTSGINFRFAGLIRPDRSDRKRFLIQANHTVRDRPDIASMDIRTGKYRVITPNPGMVTDWVLDWDDVARFGLTTENGMHSVLYRDRAGEEWSTLTTFPDEGEGWWPLGFDEDNRIAYVASNIGRATVAVYRFDTKTRQLGEMVCGDDTYDVDGALITNEAERKTVGVFYEADKPRFVYWDPVYAKRQAIIDRSLPEMTNRQIDVTQDGSKVLVECSSDREPGVYYLYDEKNKRLEQVAVTRPNVDPRQLARMEPISFQARDGLTLHGYLTLPVNREPKQLPLIIHPHGGPFGPRDVWGYNPEVQLYANRGFAVLQVNYRGSGGYGAAFQKAGYRQWGLAMQDDLTDAVKWAVARGLAHPDRVVISGASYGGYAVLAGLTFTPELYCAGVNYVGVSDLVMLGDPARGQRDGARWFRIHVGDLDSERKKLSDSSPVNFVERIRAPLLVAYGKNDPRVHIDQYYGLEQALKRAGKAFDVVIEKNEGHGFRKEEAAIAFYTRVDEFLIKNLPFLSAAAPASKTSQ